MSTELALKASIYDIIAEYDEKKAAIPALISAHEDAETCLKSAAYMRDAHGGGGLYRGHREPLNEGNFKNHLKRSAWRYLYTELKISDIAPEAMKREFENFLQNPTEFTADNIRSIFKSFVNGDDRRQLFLQSFADLFAKLSKAYKSHDPFKIGVKGLPKRVIVEYCGERFHSHGWDKIADLMTMISRVKGRNDKYRNVDAEKLVKSDAPYHLGLSFKYYKNGNVHVIFDDETLKITNELLAEYYGEVLPDAADAGATGSNTASTAVSKDLQFYPTPDIIADKLVSFAELSEGDKILEPSCGDGALLDAIKRLDVRDVRCAGVEYDAARAEICRAKGYGVVCTNFLDVKPKPDFDKILMNPPFYGKHYVKHIDHAFKFLKPGGGLFAILPATARYTHDALKGYGFIRWRDLPTGSFKESGTGVHTTMLFLRKSA